jgi:hypothetical protein
MNHSNTDSMMLEEIHAGPKDFAQIRLARDKSPQHLDFSAILRANGPLQGRGSSQMAAQDLELAPVFHDTF